jgi:hypothetical protein
VSTLIGDGFRFFKFRRTERRDPPDGTVDGTVKLKPAEAGRIPVTNLAELRAYEELKEKIQAAGGVVPKAMPPVDEPMPKKLLEIMRAVDAVLPKLLKDNKLTFEAVFGEAPTVRGKASGWHKTVLGANAIAVAAVAVEIGKQVASPADLLTIGGVGLAAWKAAGAMTYLTHWALDNYNVFGTDSFEFQVHHQIPRDLANWDASLSMYNVGGKVLPLLMATAALGPSIPVATAALVFLGGALLAPNVHKWLHQEDRPRVVQLLMDIGILANKHGEHHRGARAGLMEGEEAMAHVGRYDVLTGDFGGSVNGFFDAVELSRNLETLVFKFTGVEPNSWKEYPELKDIYLAPPDERVQVARRLRIEKQVKNIDAHEEKLRQAQQRALHPEVDKTPKVTEKILEHFPARIEKMKAQLEAFKDPSRLQPLKAAVEKAEARINQLRSPMQILMRTMSKSSTAAKEMRAAEQQLRLARAALLDVAPFLQETGHSLDNTPWIAAGRVTTPETSPKAPSQ